MKVPFFLSAIAFTVGLSIAQEIPAEKTSVNDSVSVVSTESDSAHVKGTVADSVIASPIANSTPSPKDSTVETNSTIQPLSVTRLSGTLQGFLKANASPYLVEQDISIEKDNALIIEPGVVLQFAPGTGLYVKGQLIIAGARLNRVHIVSADTSGNKKWKGIFISSDAENEIRYTFLSDAENGIVVENGNLSLESVSIDKTSQRGIFAKNSKVSLSSCIFKENAGVALHVSNYTVAELQYNIFRKNNIALLNSALAKTEVNASTFEENTHAILDEGNSKLFFSNTEVYNNTYGATSNDILDKSVKESIQDNGTNFGLNLSSILALLPPEPEIPGVQRRAVKPGENIGDLATSTSKGTTENSAAKPLSIIGNVMLGANFHKVLTRRNPHKFSDIVGNDTIKAKQHYRNIFQVPGIAGEASAYLLMQMPHGGTLEFDANLTADSWNHFSPNPVTLTYYDEYNHAVLGDFQKISGDIYMSGLPVFGANYTLSLGKNNGDLPMFEIDAFAGEAQKSLVPGVRHPDMYNTYIEDGSAQAQRMVAGGSFKWSPVRRFDTKLGLLYSDDNIKDPFIRKGSSSALTSEPLQESFTLFADGNWLFYPGDIELNGQIAMGRSDTAEVFAERAFNSVFQEAGINAASYSSLRKFMVNESEINRLTQAEFEEIFGDNTTMTRSEMRDSLKTLIKKANSNRKKALDSYNDEKVLGMKWSGQNLAIGASLFWSLKKTTISSHLKYVGENYFSAGSSDLLADTRELGANLEQIISKYWVISLGYQINIENAAKDGKSNIFGLGEGTTVGFGSASDKWEKTHELDNDRTKYIHNINFTNNSKVNDKIDVNVSYDLEYRTQYRPTRIHGIYALNEEIYKDSWFAKRKGKESTIIYYDGDSTEVDKERWKSYTETSSEPYLASAFQERIFKHTWRGDVSIKAFKSVFKLGGAWALRTDNSVFHNDSLMKKFDLSKETWSKMGYYFGGADYFEQRYPLSATTTLSSLQNKIAVTPRFKSYERADMSESEISIEDELEMPLLNRFLILGANGAFRYLNTSWTQDGKDVSESETDVLGNVKVRVNHTKKLNSEWFIGTAMYYRPENLSNDYKDAFGGVRVNYVF